MNKELTLLNKKLIDKVIHNETLDFLSKIPLLSSEEKYNQYFILSTKLKNSFIRYKGMNKRKANFRKHYSKYLSSKEWKELRLSVFERDKYLCLLCERKIANHCHHLSYGNFVVKGFSVRIECCSLCLTCHELVHGRKMFGK